MGASEGKDCFLSEQLSFSGSPSGSEVLKERVEKVINAYNSVVEESQQRTDKLKQAIMREASILVSKYEESQAKNLEEVNEKMNALLENLGSELEELETQEEKLKRFSSGLGLLVKDIPL